MDLFLIRLLFVILTALSCYELQPLGLSRLASAGVGALFGAAVVLFEIRLRQVSLKRLIGAVIGSILGIIGAYLFSLVIHNSIKPGPDAELPAAICHAADGLHRPGRRCRQG